MGFSSRIETVTPAKAAEWLGNNPTNREISARRVSRYAADMASGSWKFNGQPVILNGDGRLLDGQHRLGAIIESQTSHKMLVVRGVASEAFDTLDQLRPRSLADVLGIEGEAEARLLSSAVNWLHNFDAGLIGGSGRNQALTNTAGLEFVRQRPDLRASVELVSKLALRKAMIRRGMLAGIHFLLAQNDKAQAKEFIERLSDGAGLRPGDPRLALREKLIDAAASGATGSHPGAKKVTDRLRAAWTIKAWNFWRHGEKVDKSTLRFRSKGKKAEAFPIPV